MRSSSRVTSLDLLASMLSIIIQPSAISVHVSTRNDDVPEHALIRQQQFATHGFYDRRGNYVTPYINSIEFMITSDR